MSLETQAQINNNIFHGGNVDGHTILQYVQPTNGIVFQGNNGDGNALTCFTQNSNNTLFRGGNADGHAVLRYTQPTNGIVFRGNNGDGHVLTCYTQPINSGIFNGGIADGHTQRFFVQPTNGILFGGGNGDGFAIRRFAQTENNGIFIGGEEDGHALSCSWTGPFDPRILYVDSTATGAATGFSWVNAFTELRDALNYASQHPRIDSILVAKGRYLPTNTSNRNASFVIPDSVVILGGFPNEGSGPAGRNPAAFPSSLSGDIGTAGIATDNVYHVLTINPGRSGIRIDGFIIRDGYANGGENEGRGAALLALGKAEFRTIRMLSNVGINPGAVVYCSGVNASIRLRDCELRTNTNSNSVALLNSSGATIKTLGTTTVVED